MARNALANNRNRIQRSVYFSHPPKNILCTPNIWPIGIIFYWEIKNDFSFPFERKIEGGGKFLNISKIGP
jgi:hypothetical protein